MLFVYWLISNLLAIGVIHWKSDNYYMWRQFMLFCTGQDSLVLFYEVRLVIFPLLTFVDHNTLCVGKI
jgi:hypothetical protein